VSDEKYFRWTSNHRSVLRLAGPARPQVGSEPDFEAGQGGDVGPRTSGQDIADGRVVHTGEPHRVPQASLSQAAVTVIDSTDICAQIDRWRAEDRERAGKGSGGRPGSLSHRAVLVVLLLLALEHSPLLVSRMAETLAHRLSDAAKARLGITTDGTTSTDSYTRTWRAVHSLLAVIDPFPGPRNRLFTKAEWADIIAARDPEYAARKQVRIDWVANRLMEATMRMVPRDVRRRWKGNACIDATPVAAFGKRGTTKKSAWVGIEPDAAWYVREGDHRDQGDSPDGDGKIRKGGPKSLWGWEATLAVMSTNDPSGPDEFPYLVAAMGFGKPGHDVAGHGVRAFSSIVERGYPVRYAVADRAYFPNSKPENLQLPLCALGYDLVFDYKETQLGVTESYAGAIQVEGAWSGAPLREPRVAADVLDGSQHHRGVQRLCEGRQL